MTKISRHSIATFAAILGTTSPVFAEALDGGLYIRGFVGFSDLSSTTLGGDVESPVSFDTRAIAGAAFGYDLDSIPLRSEIEFAYRTADADSFAGGTTGDFASTSLSLNAYFDLDAVGGTRFTPYIGAGITYVTEIDFDLIDGLSEDEFSDRGGIAFQLMAGTEFALTNRLSLNGEVRYFDAGNQTLSSDDGRNITADYDTVEAILGLTFNF